MPKLYNKSEIAEKIEVVIKNNEISKLYKEPYIKRIGRTKDTSEWYSEVASEKLLASNIKMLFLSQVEMINRENYRVKHYDKINPKSPRDEEKLAITLKGKNLNTLGVILEHQIPLKASNQDKGVGKIDLVSLGSKDGSVFIVELKAKGNPEGLLKAILEIVTYEHQLNKNRFLNDMNVSGKVITKAVLLEEGSQGYREAIELGSRVKLKKLIKYLGVKIFLLENRKNYFVKVIG